MSLKPSFQKKSVSRHVKRISECSVQDKPKEEDILNQLRKYRRQKSRNSVNEDSLSRTEKSLGTYLRPGSAGNGGSIFSAIKTQELFPIQPDKKPRGQVNQVFIEQSVDRLYRGSRPQTQSIDLQKTAFFQLADVVCDKKVEQLEASLKVLDESSNKSILNDLIYLKPLRFDLELNWEIARGKDILPNESRMGVFYALEDKLKNPANVGPLNSFSLEPIVKELKDCTRLFRDILRGIMTKGADDEGVLIEMLWKVLFGIIDKALAKHEYSLNSVIECTKARIKETNEKFTEIVERKTREYNSMKEKLDKQVVSCLEQINVLTHEKNEFIRMVNEKSRTIVELTEVESQEKACVELRQLLGKLSSYITESESEQNKQVATLNHLSFVIRAADILREKPQTTSEGCQTEIQVSESHLPELHTPIFSSHPMFPIFIKHIKVPPKYNAVTLCTSAFEECDGQRQYYIELIMFLLSMYKEKETLFSNLRGIYCHLLTESSLQAKFFLTLLNNSQKSYLPIEQNMFKLSAIFDKCSESGSMTIPKFIDFLQNYLQEERSFSEELLQSVTHNFPERDWSVIFDYRLSIAYEKITKPVKAMIEHENLSLSEFIEWARNKVQIWATDKELTEFFKAKTGFTPSSWFLFDTTERIKETRVEKENFLLAFINVSLEKVNNKRKVEFEGVSEFYKFKEIILTHCPEISEKMVTNSFAEAILGTSFEEIQEKVLAYDFSGLKISDSPKPKRKGAKSPVKRTKK